MRKRTTALILLLGLNVIAGYGQENIAVPATQSRYYTATNNDAKQRESIVAPTTRSQYYVAPASDTGAKHLKDLLKQIQETYKVNLLFQSNLEELKTSYRLTVNNKELEQVLKELLEPLMLTSIKLNKKNYVIKRSPTSSKTGKANEVINIAADSLSTLRIIPASEQKNIERILTNNGIEITNSYTYNTYPAIDTQRNLILIRGRVISEQREEPVGNASVYVKGAKYSASTDAAGQFVIRIPEKTKTLLISQVNFETIEVPVKPTGGMLFVSMKPRSEVMVATVVSTGIFARKKESFTGAVTSFSGDQLKLIGNQNLVQSLKTLDPSFIIMENNTAGSNPNVLPSIEMRGQSSLTTNTLKDQFNTDPNMPLFVLDGFVASLQVISDLDINRIASVTLLKDAASTAMYGAKAANGVVVIETKKPKQGKMRLNYSGDFSVQAPDLSSYNMMNSSEEVQFEKLAGRYTISPNTASWPTQYYLDALYNSHLKNVQQGVNTYWLNEPVQIGLTAGNSVYAEGGDSTVRIGLGMNYKSLTGAMKGSNRKTYSGSIDFSYRKGKFNVGNKLYINGYNADNSPYGSFQTFVNAPTYFAKRDSNGVAQTYLEVSKDYTGNTFYVYNPLYNALLPGINNSKSLGFSDNLQLIYTINPSLQLQGAVSINQNNTTNITFVSPDNTLYKDSSIFGKGKYTNQSINSFNYQANLSLTYGKVFNRVHQLTGNIRAEIEQTNNSAIQFAAIGFPTGSNGNPAFSFSYQNNSRPSTATSLYRRNNAIASINYVYNRRYFLDATYRIDGSTAFGSNKKYTGFYSAGIGWNLHNETLFKNVRWINSLRLKLNTGTSSNQSFGSLTSVATYTYDSYINLFGQGLDLATMGNPNLRWQVTTQTNLGTDMILFKNRLSFTANAYTKITDPMVVVVPLPSSTGISNYPMNAGRINTKGMDFTGRYSIISKPVSRVFWSLGLTVGMYKSEYQNFNGMLNALNKLNQLNNVMARYTDGYSPDDLWAVQSKGIDPATGREIFLKKNGQLTFNYDATDAVKVGNSQPVVQGVISTQLSYKGFMFSASIRYSYGEDIFNTALYNKVENITYTSIGNNQDRRALYDRWQKPGDISQFKGIYLVSASGAGVTKMSSRFVQRENFISGESVSMGYDFMGKKWIKTLGMESFRVMAYANDLFRVSTIKRERGTDYPFTNTFSLSVSAAF
jgi:TonB-linked SusC/RagA family outer membrane protein